MTIALGAPRPSRVWRQISRWAPAFAVFAVVGGVWEWAAKAGHLPISVPAPSAVWTEFGKRRETLWFHTGPTLASATRGYLAAVVVAAIVSVLVVLWPRVAGTAYTTAVLISSIPLIALTPILVLWLDRGDTVRATIAALAGFFPILVGCLQGLRATNVGSEELFDTLSARRWQRFVFLGFPTALPFVFAGLKAAAASSILGAIIAEWSGGGGTRGLGQMMTNALFGFNVPQTWLTILTAAALAVAAYGAIAVAERLIVRWDHQGAEGDV